MLTFDRRSWLYYWIAWLPYAGVYALTMLSVPDVGPGLALYGAVETVLPAALLGMAVPPLCSRISWSHRRRVRFFAVHAVAAAAFSALSLAASLGLWAALHRLRGKPIPPVPREAVISQFLIGLFVYSTIAGILYAVDAAAIARRQRERLAEARAAQAHLELRVLRSQLNPHFLFNTLHSLHALVQEEPAEAMRAIERFGGLLRYTLAANREPSARVTLAEEWAFVESYLALESIRLGDRLRLDVRIEPGALGCPLPAFTLQPLVENAIRHGVAPRPGGGELAVAGRRVGDLLELSVADDGPGVGPAPLAALRAGLNGGAGEPPAGPRNGRGGLALVARGLAAVYGDRHRFTIASNPGGGFRLELSLPVTADDDGGKAEAE